MIKEKFFPFRMAIIMATKTKFADEKLAEKLLSDDKLDNVAGGATQLTKEEVLLWIKAQQAAPGYKRGDERTDINPAFMSEAFINGEITGGEDF